MKLNNLRDICEKAEKTWDVLRLTPPEVLALLDALEECTKALSYYCDPLSWDWPISGKEENSMIDINDCGEVEGLCDFRGGKRARTALKTIEEKLKGLG